MRTVPRRNARTRIGSLFSTALLGLVLVSLFVHTIILIARQDEPSITTNLLLQITLLAVFWWWSTSHSGTFLNAPFVLLLAVFFWHSSLLAGRFLHLADVFEYPGWILTYGQEFVSHAVALVSLCLAFGALGCLIAFWQRAEKSQACQTDVRPHVIVDPALERYALLLFSAYVLLTIAYVAKEGPGSGQDYLDLYTQASYSLTYRAYHMTKFLGVTVIALLIATAKSRVSIAVAYAGTAFLVFVSALTGARTMPFLYCATALIVIDHFRKRVPFVAIVGMAAAASAASWIITEGRGTGVGLQLLTSIHTGKPISLWGLFWNAGETVGTVIRTMAFTAPTGPIHGRSFIEAFVYVLPGPVVKFLAPGWAADPPSVWLIKQSPDVDFGWGLGYSLVAEAFLNFGMWGCLLFLFIGWLVAYLYFAVPFRRNSFAGLQSITLVVLLSMNMRNDSVTYFRVLIWSALIIASAQLIYSRRRPRGERQMEISIRHARTGVRRLRQTLAMRAAAKRSTS